MKGCQREYILAVPGGKDSANSDAATTTADKVGSEGETAAGNQEGGLEASKTVSAPEITPEEQDSQGGRPTGKGAVTGNDGNIWYLAIMANVTTAAVPIATGKHTGEAQQGSGSKDSMPEPDEGSQRTSSSLHLLIRNDPRTVNMHKTTSFPCSTYGSDEAGAQMARWNPHNKRGANGGQKPADIYNSDKLSRVSCWLAAHAPRTRHHTDANPLHNLLHSGFDASSRRTIGVGARHLPSVFIRNNHREVEKGSLYKLPTSKPPAYETNTVIPSAPWCLQWNSYPRIIMGAADTTDASCSQLF
ncbi:hypothetical protein CSUB01_11383 [Colletotrichum sublineola]|uniref:Uncharacterized protein n=1 Tax=Colletotrichum sublineola TaxID=1173701 RepID=A0A066X2N4_COLSU|nr:hypothetical protein CSUB01_11383 [Colletotrichum sublineola]